MEVKAVALGAKLSSSNTLEAGWRFISKPMIPIPCDQKPSMRSHPYAPSFRTLSELTLDNLDLAYITTCEFL
jgi:hypothetical protein